MALTVLRRYNTVTGQTTSGTINTNTTHPHGLITRGGKAVTPTNVIITETGPNLVQFVSADATNITVKSAVASSTFNFTAFY